MEAKAIPRHHIDDTDTIKTLNILGWTISVENHPISNAAQLDELYGALGVPLPEMTYGKNKIKISHKESGWSYEFNTLDALKQVKNGPLEEGDGAVQVAHAEAWLKSRTDPNSQTPMPETVATKPYDWTYTTMYEGGTSHDDTSGISFQPGNTSDNSHVIPMDELQRRDPILFYGQTLLFEDELHDNGSSFLLIRIRVMPGCIFLLARFTLRVDRVIFRTFDTRLYHSFASSPPLVIKESIGLEATYDSVKQQLEDTDDLTPLTDATFVANTLSSFSPQQKQQGAGTGWRGIGRKSEIVVLQKGAAGDGIS